ncbi:Ribosomal RNA small subunit methyltransferase I [Candidatus Cyrtobacter comes]|uniref:Ribosomal RNA small subunit methyltransferase I n=1 Tax=Candidatus Cyrtobacter comes TaxID=675776 RepID=A0ABU5L8M1_9RICK|nr:16S rRNA (cytidine(1402)-2'-O)-methyltransferase [Candidatus Cyrtobacter comes]MDZ5762204.1 Ribosomal RNA small subunit methyltransferase I [Candidatus Cyrtobacter comes]
MNNDNIRSYGILYVVSLPIGNLRDITLRAIDILSSVSAIVCEDSRVTSKVLGTYNIKNSMIPCYGSSDTYIIKALDILKSGKDVALVSDAGTPLISDPGYDVVLNAIKHGFKVHTIPGPCSAISALSISGIDSSNFFFYGFLPTKKNQTHQELEKILSYGVTSIIFESPRRLISTLELLKSMHPQIVIAVARELTKIFEEVIRGTVSEVLDVLNNKNVLKGEIVIVISSINKNTDDFQDAIKLLENLLLEGNSVKDSISETLSLYPTLKKGDLYKYTLQSMKR